MLHDRTRYNKALKDLTRLWSWDISFRSYYNKA